MLRWGKLEISSEFLLTSAFLFYLDKQGVFLWALLACALHEWGHYAAIRLMGGQVVRLRFTPIGGEMQLSSRRVLSYGMELAAVLAGPAVNFGTALFISQLAKEGGETLWLFAGLNLVLGCFNLLPIYPLDGGRVIRLLISILWSPDVAERITFILSHITALVLLVAGIALLWKTGRNFTLLAVAIWALATTFRTQNRT